MPVRSHTRRHREEIMEHRLKDRAEYNLAEPIESKNFKQNRAESEEAGGKISSGNNVTMKELRRQRREEQKYRQYNAEPEEPENQTLKQKIEKLFPTREQAIKITKDTAKEAVKGALKVAGGAANLGREVAKDIRVEPDEPYILSGGRTSGKQEGGNYKTVNGYIYVRRSDGSWYNTGRKAKTIIPEKFKDPTTGLEVEPEDEEEEEEDEDNEDSGISSRLGGHGESIYGGETDYKTGMFKTGRGEREKQNIKPDRFGAGTYYMSAGMDYGRGGQKRIPNQSLGAGSYYMSAGLNYARPSEITEGMTGRRRSRNQRYEEQAESAIGQGEDFAPVRKEREPLFKGNQKYYSAGDYGSGNIGGAGLSAISSGAFGGVTYKPQMKRQMPQPAIQQMQQMPQPIPQPQQQQIMQRPQGMTKKQYSRMIREQQMQREMIMSQQPPMPIPQNTPVPQPRQQQPKRTNNLSAFNEIFGSNGWRL